MPLGLYGLCMRSFLVFFLLPVILIVASCTNPVSDVGLDLLEGETSPQVKTTPATSFSASGLADITGNAPRVLVGSVDDPLAGRVSANGFFDFTGTFDGTSSESITRVQLKLSRNYNFGDTTVAAQFSLHQILAEWSESGLRSDAELKIGPAILTVTTLDTLTTVELPTSWINENERTLRSSEFEKEFHGLALIESGSGHVVGFNSALTTLELTSSNGSTTYKVGSTYTQVKRMSPPKVPDGFILFQDGIGPTIEMEFDFDELKNRPINGAILSFSADTLTNQATPPNFSRPLPRTLQLIAVPSDDTASAILVGQSTIDDSGEYLFSGSDVSLFFQRALLGSQEYKHLELRAPADQHSLNAVLLHDTHAGDLSPRVTIFLSP